MGEGGEAFGVRRGEDAAEQADLRGGLGEAAVQQQVGDAEPFGGFFGGGEQFCVHPSGIDDQVDFAL